MTQKVYSRFHWKWFFTVILFIFFYLAGILTHYIGHTYHMHHEWIFVSVIVCILVVISLLKRREIILEEKKEEETKKELELCNIIQNKLIEIDKFLTKIMHIFEKKPQQKLKFDLSCLFEKKDNIIEILYNISSVLSIFEKRLKKLKDIVCLQKNETTKNIKCLKTLIKNLNSYILKIASEIKDINHIIIAQQLDVVKHTEDAASCIIMSLNKIEESVNEIINIATKGMHELEFLYSKKADSKVETVEEVLLALKEHIQHQLDTISDNVENAIYVLNEAKSLEELIDEVKSIAEKTKLLSLNAAIEAARAGEEGRGFGVVANEVHKLADLSHKTADKMNRMISNLINSINQRFRDLMTVADSSKRKKEFETIIARINDLFKANEEATRIRNKILTEMQQQAQNVVQMVIEVLGSIQFQDITRQRIENLQSILEEINQYFEKLVTSALDGNTEEVLKLPVPSKEDMQKNYKMSKERKIHDELLNKQTSAEEPPAIELF